MQAMNTPTILSRGRVGQLAAAAGVCAALLTGTLGSALAHAADGHPARIHDGTCEALGPVAFALNGLGASVDLDDAPLATPIPVGPDTTYEVTVSETTIDGALDDLLAAEHAVMIYESDEAMEAIACGNVGGVMVGDTLVTGLAEAGAPGHVGFAMFQPEGEQTLVMVILGDVMTPLSAAGTADSHGEGEEAHEHEKDEHAEEGEDDALATPSA